MRFGKAMSGRGMLLSTMLGAMVQHMALRPLTELISEQKLATVSPATIAEAGSRPGDLVAATDIEYVCGDRTMEVFADETVTLEKKKALLQLLSKVGDGSAKPLQLLTDLDVEGARREHTAYYLRVRPALQKLDYRPT